MQFYRACLDVPTRMTRFVADLLVSSRAARGGRWWALSVWRAAKLVLVYLRTNTPLSQLGAGFGVSTATAWRYVNHVVDALSTRPDLRKVLSDGRCWVIVDGTLIVTDRVADSSFYSGHKHRFGVNVQAVTDLHGNLLWTSPGLPGSTHDLTAARHHGIPDALSNTGVTALADKGYQGAGSTMLTPTKGQCLTRSQRKTNRNNARIRSLGERGFAVLKQWQTLRRWRSCPHRVGDIVTAISTSNTR